MAARKKEPGYREATEEIDAILDRIEDSREVDVDALEFPNNHVVQVFTRRQVPHLI